MLAKEPASHVTSGATVPSKSSVAVTVTGTVAPEATSSRVAGVKVITGGSVSGAGLTRAKNTALPLLPAASRAVAVHLSITVRASALTTGAV